MCESVDTSDYRCVITQMIFKNPVACKTDEHDKHPITYENTAIRKWLTVNNSLCPMKRKPITIIEENLQMKINIEKLIKDNPELLSEQFVEEITGDSQKINQLPVESATVPIAIRSFGPVFPLPNESSFETFGTSRRMAHNLLNLFARFIGISETAARIPNVLPNSFEQFYSPERIDTQLIQLPNLPISLQRFPF